MIDFVLLTPLATEVRKALYDELKLSDSESHARCKDLLDEAPEISLHRENLMDRKDRLGKARHVIRKFKMQ